MGISISDGGWDGKFLADEVHKERGVKKHEPGSVQT